MTSYRYGYVRVSTNEQDPAGQLDAMAAAGVDRARVFVEYASGGGNDRPELAAVLDRLRPGDTLVVWRLDRLGRSMPHLITTVTELGERGVGFCSLTEADQVSPIRAADPCSGSWPHWPSLSGKSSENARWLASPPPAAAAASVGGPR